MKLSPKSKRNIEKIIPFGIIWFVFSSIYLLIEKGILGDSPTYPSTGNIYEFGENAIVSSIFSAFMGLLLGAIEVLYLNKLFINNTFTKKIVIKTLLYFIFMIIFLLLNTVIIHIVKLDSNLFDEQVWIYVNRFFTNFAFWSIQVYISVLISISLFYNEISDNLGQGIFINFLKGKYHTPIQEERLFMFLDMKSSTSIAEKLGHIEYFKFLKEYYSDLSDTILEYAGEIYQYVGDEVVISWKLNNGLDNNNFLKCFFAMKTELEKNSQKYISRFGVTPTFKAGFHYGQVTTGEIGVIKKDIIFTGDVLNTTARIQGLCNSYNVDLLVSEQLISKIILPSKFKTTVLGECELRGRIEKINLVTICT